MPVKNHYCFRLNEAMISCTIAFTTTLFFAVPSIAVPSFAEQIPDDKTEGDKIEEETINEPTLHIGSPAPSVDIKHWISLGNGKIGKFHDFKDGHIYVIDFWATWCYYCVEGMPKLVDLQKRFADNNVHIMNISDEELGVIEKFLDEEVPDMSPKTTYRDLTKNYLFVTDPDFSVYKDYMVASKLRALPTVFIVGKTGHIEWIGHSNRIEHVIEQIIDDKWDREAFKKNFELKQRAMGKIERARQCADKKEYPKALTLLRALTLEEKEATEDIDVESLILRIQSEALLGNIVAGTEVESNLLALEKQAKDSTAQGESYPLRQLNLAYITLAVRQPEFMDKGKAAVDYFLEADDSSPFMWSWPALHILENNPNHLPIPDAISEKLLQGVLKSIEHGKKMKKIHFTDNLLLAALYTLQGENEKANEAFNSAEGIENPQRLKMYQAKLKQWSIELKQPEK